MQGLPVTVVTANAKTISPVALRGRPAVRFCGNFGG